MGAAAWSSIEVNVAIICACLPTLKPLIIRIFPSLLGSTRKGPGASAGASRVAVGGEDGCMLAIADGTNAVATVGSSATDLRRVPNSSNETLGIGVYGFDEFRSLHTVRPNKTAEVFGATVREISPVCRRGNPGDTGGVVDGQIKVVTQIAQDVEIRKIGSETDMKSTRSDYTSSKSETCSERRLWEGSGFGK